MDCYYMKLVMVMVNSRLNRNRLRRSGVPLVLFFHPVDKYIRWNLLRNRKKKEIRKGREEQVALGVRVVCVFNRGAVKPLMTCVRKQFYTGCNVDTPYRVVNDHRLINDQPCVWRMMWWCTAKQRTMCKCSYNYPLSLAMSTPMWTTDDSCFRCSVVGCSSVRMTWPSSITRWALSSWPRWGWRRPEMPSSTAFAGKHYICIVLWGRFFVLVVFCLSAMFHVYHSSSWYVICIEGMICLKVFGTVEPCGILSEQPGRGGRKDIVPLR